jgi:hypothetical protein
MKLRKTRADRRASARAPTSARFMRARRASRAYTANAISDASGRHMARTGCLNGEPHVELHRRTRSSHCHVSEANILAARGPSNLSDGPQMSERV